MKVEHSASFTLRFDTTLEEFRDATDDIPLTARMGVGQVPADRPGESSADYITLNWESDTVTRRAPAIGTSPGGVGTSRPRPIRDTPQA